MSVLIFLAKLLLGFLGSLLMGVIGFNTIDLAYKHYKLKAKRRAIEYAVMAFSFLSMAFCCVLWIVV